MDETGCLDGAGNGKNTKPRSVDTPSCISLKTIYDAPWILDQAATQCIVKVSHLRNMILWIRRSYEDMFPDEEVDEAINLFIFSKKTHLGKILCDPHRFLNDLDDHIAIDTVHLYSLVSMSQEMFDRD